MKKLLAHRGIRFVLAFFGLYGLLYAINYTLTGLLAPGGLYSPWMAEHMDYVTHYRHFLLSATGWVVGLFGHRSYIDGMILRVPDALSIRMVYSCMGISLLCFWWAFVFTFPMRAGQRAAHFFIGTLLMIAINIARLSLLVMFGKKGKLVMGIIDHHTLFNIVAYAIILLMIRYIINRNSAVLSAPVK